MLGKQAEKVEGLMVLRVALRALECRVRSCWARGPGTIAGGSMGAFEAVGGGASGEGCGCGASASFVMVSGLDAGAVSPISVSFSGASGALAVGGASAIVKNRVQKLQSS